MNIFRGLRHEPMYSTRLGWSKMLINAASRTISALSNVMLLGLNFLTATYLPLYNVLHTKINF